MGLQVGELGCVATAALPALGVGLPMVRLVVRRTPAPGAVRETVGVPGVSVLLPELHSLSMDRAGDRHGAGCCCSLFVVISDVVSGNLCMIGGIRQSSLADSYELVWPFPPILFGAFRQSCMADACRLVGRLPPILSGGCLRFEGRGCRRLVGRAGRHRFGNPGLGGLVRRAGRA